MRRFSLRSSPLLFFIWGPRRHSRMPCERLRPSSGRLEESLDHERRGLSAAPSFLALPSRQRALAVARLVRHALCFLGYFLQCAGVSFPVGRSGVRFRRRVLTAHIVRQGALAPLSLASVKRAGRLVSFSSGGSVCWVFFGYAEHRLPAWMVTIYLPAFLRSRSLRSPLFACRRYHVSGVTPPTVAAACTAFLVDVAPVASASSHLILTRLP